MRPYAGADYYISFFHSRLRIPGFHPNYKGERVGWEGLSYWLVTHLHLSANFQNMLFFVNMKMESTTVGRGREGVRADFMS
jgi:hypothetical protein